jgi:hypothetical protein
VGIGAQKLDTIESHPARLREDAQQPDMIAAIPPSPLRTARKNRMPPTNVDVSTHFDGDAEAMRVTARDQHDVATLVAHSDIVGCRSESQALKRTADRSSSLPAPHEARWPRGPAQIVSFAKSLSSSCSGRSAANWITSGVKRESTAGACAPM